MLDKGAIEVAGFIQSTKNYARTFAPTLTADEYIVLQLKHSSAFNEQALLRLVSSLVEDVRDEAVLNEINSMVEKRKAELH